MKATRLVVIGDLHAGPDRSSLRGSLVKGLLSEWIDFVNENIQPDGIVELGDRLNPVDRENDIETLREISGILAKSSCPVYYIPGNHDLDNLTQEEHERAIGSKLGNRSVVVKGLRLLLLNTQDPIVQGVGGMVSDEALRWLEKEIVVSSEKKVVFTHQALDEQPLKRNVHFESIENLAYVENKRELLRMFERGGNVIAAINGHVHWPSIALEKGVLYVSVPSFTDTWNQLRSIPGSFTLIDFSGEEVIVENHMFRPSILMGRFRTNRKKEG
ncbi:metallophosphoesterase family protein [Mesotoga sp. UBA5825]|uniref:metallophosphoesterase family protein n=1 Tax=Mesotoga sp. UBA5825 TaxID=1946858 RepID=UPI0025E54B15|nr:metallophosphoesterase [Mesotoga sp. UBA5825]